MSDPFFPARVAVELAEPDFQGCMDFGRLLKAGSALLNRGRLRRGCSRKPARSTGTGVRSSPTGQASIASSSASTSRCRSCGTNISSANRRAIATSAFCELYRGWEGKLSATMRQSPVGGDKLFGDYAGDTVPVIVDPLTGKARQARIFVAGMSQTTWRMIYDLAIQPGWHRPATTRRGSTTAAT
jgi:hypothetical protein